MHEKLDDLLEHSGVKGMKWGVIRKKVYNSKVENHKTKVAARQRVLKSVGSKVSNKAKDVGSKVGSKVKEKSQPLAKRVSSMKREHSWHKALRDIDNLSTKDINRIAQRAQLENDLKRLAGKKMVGSKKHKEDYLNRANMSDQELHRKVTRLRAIDSLTRNAKEATRAQREFGKKVLNIAGPLSVQFALTGKVGSGDVLSAITNPHSAKQKAIKSLTDKAKSYAKDDKD